jgi:hypothetical protein
MDGRGLWRHQAPGPSGSRRVSGEMRLRERGLIYRSPMTTQSKRVEQLLSFCKRKK